MSDKKEKVMIITRGPSGSGKSTMIQNLMKNPESEKFSSDDFFMQNGKYVFNGSLIGKAHEWNRQRVENAAQKGVPFIIVDNTNTQLWEMKPYVEIAQRHGYKVEFKEPDWHPELKTPEGKWNADFIKKMQKSQDRSSINKTVPDEVVDRMISRYEYNPTVESIMRSKR